MPLRITTAEGNEVEVDPKALADSLPDGVGLYGAAPDLGLDFGDPADYTPNAKFESALDERVESIIKTRKLVDPSDVDTDARFKAMASRRGIQLGDDLKPVEVIKGEVLEQYQREWYDANAKPLKEERDRLADENTTLRRRSFVAETQAELLDELKGKAFTASLPGIPSPFQALVNEFVKFDGEGKPFFQPGPSAVPNHDVKAGILEYVKRHAEDLLADHRNTSSRHSDRGRGDGNTKTLTRSRFDRLGDDDKAAFFKNGGRLVDG